ncbi:MAG TPA: hypothetical protein ENH10_01110 [Bacteroidetes bacterium]|nr:hypothetical protein BMS3Bbin04_01628 [bacterium BMS3Bbin04]HDO64618.1 hypothetical protein [Bacteroidota bacterium]HEX03743.1 hypothetical protein [Bacteroidota bacterium]
MITLCNSIRLFVVVLVTVTMFGASAPSFAQDAPPDSTVSPIFVGAQADTLVADGETRSDTLLVAIENPILTHQGVKLSKSPVGAALRSAAIPGWGQLYVDNWMFAVVFAGVDAGLIYGTFVQHDRYLGALEDAEGAKRDDDRILLERSANFYRDDRNKLGWYIAGITLLASLDAYVEAHLHDFYIDPILATPPNNDGLQIGFRFTFSL